MNASGVMTILCWGFITAVVVFAIVDWVGDQLNRHDPDDVEVVELEELVPTDSLESAWDLPERVPDPERRRLV